MTILSQSSREPFLKALKEDNQESLQNLLSNYSDINIIIPKKNTGKRTKPEQSTILDNDPYLVDVAAYYGSEHCLRFLLSSSQSISSISHHDKQLFSIAHFATQSGKIQVCKILEDFKFNFLELSRSGTTPLHIAAKNGFVEIFQWIWLNYPDSIEEIKTFDSEGYTAFHLASINHHLDILDFLISFNVDPNIFTSDGRTAFDIAIINNDDIMIDYFLSHPNIPQIANGKGSYSIHVATYNHRSDILERMVELGYDMFVHDKRNHSALHIAAARGDYGICLFLLELGFDVNERDIVSRTPLHLAARNGHDAVCELLIDFQANISPVDNDGYTPMNLAYLKNRKACIELFSDFHQNNDNIDMEDTHKHKKNKKWTSKLKNVYIDEELL